MNKIIKIMSAVMIVAIIMTTSHPVKAAEKLSKKDFVAVVSEGTEKLNLFDELNDSGEGLILFVYDKKYDKSKKGAVKTSRGIYIGSKASTVASKYGKVTKGSLLKDIAYNQFIDNKSTDFKPFFKNVEYVLCYKYIEKNGVDGEYTSRIHLYIDKDEKVAAVAFSRTYSSEKLTYFNKGISYNLSGDYQTAIDNLDKCLQIDPQFTGAYVVKGDCLLSLNKLSEAIECYDKAINIPFGDTAYVYNKKGLALYYSDKFEEAIISFDLAIIKDPTFLTAYFNKAYSLFYLNNYTDCLSVCDTLISLDVNYAAAYYMKSTVYAIQNNVIELIANLKKAVEIDNSYIEEAKAEEAFDSYRDTVEFKELMVYK